MHAARDTGVALGVSSMEIIDAVTLAPIGSAEAAVKKKEKGAKARAREPLRIGVPAQQLQGTKGVFHIQLHGSSVQCYASRRRLFCLLQAQLPRAQDL